MRLLKKIFCCFFPSASAEGEDRPILQSPLLYNEEQAPAQPIDISSSASSEQPPAPRGSMVSAQGNSPEPTHDLQSLAPESSQHQGSYSAAENLMRGSPGSTRSRQSQTPAPSEHQGSYSSAMDLMGGSSAHTSSQSRHSSHEPATSVSSSYDYSPLKTPSRGMSRAPQTPESSPQTPESTSQTGRSIKGRARSASVSEIEPFSFSF